MFSNTFKVIDIHAHLPSPSIFIHRHEVTDQYNAYRGERMRLTWDFPDKSHESEEVKSLPIIDRWLAELDKYNIGKLIFLTANNNDDLAQQVSKYPDRFIGFAHHSIEEPNALEELQRSIDQLGLKGYKMFGPLVERPFHDPSLHAIWEFLEEREIPVLIHFGMLGRAGGIVHHQNISPLSIFQVARNHPRLPILIPHFGAGYFQELLHLCWSCPNIYIDTSGSNQWVRWMPYHLDLEIMFRKAFELIGSERIVYGSDSNGFPRGYAYRYLQDQVRTCRDINLKEEDIENIFGNNARRLLGIETGVNRANVTS